MIKKIILFSILVLFPLNSLMAQYYNTNNSNDSGGDVRNDLDAELDVLYKRSGGNIRDPRYYKRTTTLPNGEVVEIEDIRNQQEPLYDNLRSNPNNRNQYDDPYTEKNFPVHRQRTTYIESSPLKESKAERMRRLRKEAEVETEQMIVQELEKMRMEEEKKRLDKILGGKKNDNQVTTTNDIEQNDIEQVDVMVTPVPAENYNSTNNSTNNSTKVKSVKEEVQEVEEDMGIGYSEYKKSDKSRFFDQESYMFGIVGMGEYVDTINMTGSFALGAGLGIKNTEKLHSEFAFVYSNYDIDESAVNGHVLIPIITNMDQYSFMGILKYKFLSGKLHPVIGGILNYSYRTYSSDSFSLYSAEASSHSLDIGWLAGVNLELSDNFTLGVDYRYIFNMYNRTSSEMEYMVYPYLYSYVKNGTPVEEISHYIFSLSAQFRF